VSSLSYGFKINIFGELHVLSVDSEDFHTANLIRHANVDLSVETTGTTKRWVDRVRSVCGANDDDLAAALGTVHERQQLSDDTLLDLSLSLFSIGSNRVDFVNEDNRGGVLLALLEGLTQILLSLTLHFGHDFGSIEQEEESACLVGNSLRDKGLSRAWWSIQKHTLGRLHTERLEELRMPKRQLNHLTNLGELFPHSTNVVISNVFGLFFVISVDGITLVEKCCLRGDDTVLRGLDIDNLELDGAEATTNNESVSLLNRTIAVLEVGDEIGLGDVSSDAFDRVSEGQNVDLSCVWDVIWAGVYRHDVSHPDT